MIFFRWKKIHQWLIRVDVYKCILMAFEQHLHVICKIVFILDVYLKSMRYFIKVVFANTTYEAGRLKNKIKVANKKYSHMKETTDRSLLLQC